MRDLPRSVYSTPGMVGLGNAKIIEESDQDFGGMQIVYAARTAAISKVRAPCFGFTNGTYQEKPYRAAVLVASQLIVPEQPDVVAQYNFHIIGKDDFMSGTIYKPAAFFRSDPKSKEVFDSLPDDACILDLNYGKVHGLAQFEPSIRVLTADAALGDDRDAIKLGAVLRRHPWRKQGWLRLESLDELVGPAWTAADLMKLAKQFNPEVETLEAVMEPPPPMGVVPSAPAFDAIAPDVMLINGTHFAVGARPGGLAHALEYAEDGEMRYGVIARAVRPGEPVPIVESLTGPQMQYTECVLHGPRPARSRISAWRRHAGINILLISRCVVNMAHMQHHVRAAGKLRAKISREHAIKLTERHLQTTHAHAGLNRDITMIVVPSRKRHTCYSTPLS